MAKAGLPAGTRDFLPERLIFRQKVIGIMKEVFERYGFLPLETPAVERLDVLSGKYGEEADRLIFKVLKRGEELKSAREKGEELADMGLRYDLTVPLCRVIAMHQNEISFPFRRYQIQPVWRADKPQKGRYREFYQCDVDIVGQEAPLPDAELMALTYDTLIALGFENFLIRYNHRQLLSTLAEKVGIPKNKESSFFIALDKLEKIGFNGLKTELKRQGLQEEAINHLVSIFETCQKPGLSHEVLSKELSTGELNQGSDALYQVIELGEYSRLLGVPERFMRWDLSLARGLEYYTGPIFEVTVPESGIGSICGGGRYNELIEKFTGNRTPATGTAFGLERIIDLLVEMRKFDILASKKTTRVLVAPLYLGGSSRLNHYVLEIAKDLRNKKISTEIHPSPQKSLGDKLSWASKRSIPFVVIVGEEEMVERTYSFKNMASGQQMKLNFGELPPELKEHSRQ